MTTNNKGGGSATAWIIGIVLVAAMIGGLSNNNNSSTSSPSYSPSSGKPYDMPQDQWDYVNNRLRQEFPSDSNADIDKASRAIWEFEKQRKARGEH
ncbi:MAG: hypothetical protein IT422_12655 [Pirellulaceae bacterium]|nr:hypothetical protein [Pirellulaceae bacterium]